MIHRLLQCGVSRPAAAATPSSHDEAEVVEVEDQPSTTTGTSTSTAGQQKRRRTSADQEEDLADVLRKVNIEIDINIMTVLPHILIILCYRFHYSLLNNVNYSVLITNFYIVLFHTTQIVVIT